MRSTPHRAFGRLPSAVLVLLLTTPALAQTSAELMLRPFAERTPFDASATGYGLAEGRTDAGDDYQLSIVDLAARYRFAPRERFDPRLGLDATYLNLASDSPVLPDGLLDTSVAVGLGVYEDRVEGWQAGVTLGLGYAGVVGGGAGDDLFADQNAWYGKASIIVGKRFNKTDGLIFILDYDGNRTFKPDVPLPGFAYQKLIFGNPDPARRGGRFEPQLLLTVGLPFANVRWQPVEHLTIDLTYFIPDNFRARVDYDLLPSERLGVFALLEARREAFHWNALRHGDDRILYFQRRAEVGLRWSPAANLNFNVAGGYAFGQELTTGFDATNEDKLVDLADRPYLRVGVEVGF